MISFELFGSPGCGKTSLYERLKRRSSRKYYNREEAECLFLAYLLGLPESQYQFSDSIYIALARNAATQKIARFIHRLYFREFFERFDTLPDYISEIIEHSVYSDVSDELKLKRLEWIKGTVIRSHMINRIHSSQVCISEEMLCQIGMNFIGARKPIRECLDSYYMKVKMPEILVYCKLDKDEIFTRLIKRKRRAMIHKHVSNNDIFNLIDHQILVVQVCLSCAVKRGCKIITLDMSNKLDDNAGILHDTLQNFSSKLV